MQAVDRGQPAGCFHGGAFFDAIGDEFDALERSRDVINADVLDAWFPPSPKVLEALREHLPWLVRTSPPTGCEGLVRAIARGRGVPEECVLPGAGSSSLIFLTLPRWLTQSSRALVLDPSYGEYTHVLEQVIGCRVDRLPLSRADDYAVDLSRLEACFREEYDLIVLVNPNNPTGRHVPRAELEEVLTRVPARTRVWVDEAYVEYAGPNESLERFASQTRNVVGCKSMSKVYALSGLRAAYLCASPVLLEDLRTLTPPWAVSLPAQVAAVNALDDPDYYARRYRQTHTLRSRLMDELSALGQVQLVPGVANFVLCHLDPDAPEAATVLQQCRAHNLFLRDASATAPTLGKRAVRIAVKDSETNRRMVEVLRKVICG